MHVAAAKGHLDILLYFVEKKGADLVHKAGGYNAFTPLHNACSGGHLACVKYLMSVGANPEARDIVRHRHPPPLSHHLSSSRLSRPYCYSLLLSFMRLMRRLLLLLMLPSRPF